MRSKHVMNLCKITICRCRIGPSAESNRETLKNTNVHFSSKVDTEKIVKCMESQIIVNSYLFEQFVIRVQFHLFVFSEWVRLYPSLRNMHIFLFLFV